MKKNYLYWVLLLVSIGITSSCSDEKEDEITKSKRIISEQLSEIEGISQFAKAFENEDFTLLSEQNLTVLAPINPITKTQSETSNVERQIIQDKLSFEELKQKASIKSITGEILQVKVKNNDVYINDVKVIAEQATSNNGNSYFTVEKYFPLCVECNIPLKSYEGVRLNLLDINIDTKILANKKVEYAFDFINTDDNTKARFDYTGNNPSLQFIALEAGTYPLNFIVTGEVNATIPFSIDIKKENTSYNYYLTKVFDFLPAVGQFTNKLPVYEEGDTQEIMNKKVLESIGNGKKGMISLGGYGGYVVVGFDHTIINIKGKRDFRVLGNAFYAAGNPDPNAPIGGSCEPGIIMVAYDKNKNGKPDDDEWYEIAGSAHNAPEKEAFYAKALKVGNNVNFYNDFEITYFKPSVEPTTPEDKKQYIQWEDNKGNKGYKEKNNFHHQPYFPQWINDEKITFKGSRLPENGIDESGQGNYFVLYKFHYGYADNDTNVKDDSAIDIDWAIDKNGNKVHLPGIDFIKVYTGVNQENGWLGENSTEVSGVEDLHIKGIDIATRE